MTKLIRDVGIVMGAAAVGVVFGVAIEMVGRKNGRPGMADGALTVLKQVVAGFALGSIAAATFVAITNNTENPEGEVSPNELDAER